VGILWLSYCVALKPHLGTKIISFLYSWFPRITDYKYNFHFEQPQSLEKVLVSPPFTQVLHFIEKLPRDIHLIFAIYVFSYI